MDAEDSKGKGEYWIDPENDGNPLKVLCDISDDGCKCLMIMTMNLRWLSWVHDDDKKSKR